MKKELIDKLLNEQTTPEEEHLIAQELRQEEDIERWLIEDETALYDSIVAKRQAKRRYLRWAIAAVIIALDNSPCDKWRYYSLAPTGFRNSGSKNDERHP